MAKRQTFTQKLNYVFSPKEDKGTTWFERAVITFALKAEDAWVADPTKPEEKRLLEGLHRAAEKMHLVPPEKLLVYKSNKPNAAMLNNGTVVVGTDLMRILDDKQMDAVLAHELSHFKHKDKDARISAAIFFPVAVGTWMAMNRFVHTHFKLGNVTKFITNLYASWNVGSLVTLPYRRFMETRADIEGAMATSPDAKIGALQTLKERSNELYREHYKATHGKDAEPHNASWLEKTAGKVARATDPHPTIKDRVSALERLKSESQTTSEASLQSHL